METAALSHRRETRDVHRGGECLAGDVAQLQADAVERIRDLADAACGGSSGARVDAKRGV